MIRAGLENSFRSSRFDPERQGHLFTKFEFEVEFLAELISRDFEVRGASRNNFELNCFIVLESILDRSNLNFDGI